MSTRWYSSNIWLWEVTKKRVLFLEPLTCRLCSSIPLALSSRSNVRVNKLTIWAGIHVLGPGQYSPSDLLFSFVEEVSHVCALTSSSAGTQSAAVMWTPDTAAAAVGLPRRPLRGCEVARQQQCPLRPCLSSRPSPPSLTWYASSNWLVPVCKGTWCFNLYVLICCQSGLLIRYHNRVCWVRYREGCSDRGDSVNL
jgi:hypothetical protein